MTVAVSLFAPFAAWASPLEEVPDPAFAGRMLGDGVALDPLEGQVRAPCDAEIIAIAPTGHSVTLRSEVGAEVLIHVGIDTVELGGRGFDPIAKVGSRVRQGDLLLAFDLDGVARSAKSLITPMVVLTPGFEIVGSVGGQTVAAGDFVCRLVREGQDESLVPIDGAAMAGISLVVPLAHGLHARPASRIVAALKPFSSDVRLGIRGRTASARSVTAILSLGVSHGDQLSIEGLGTDAAAAVDAVAELIAGGMGELEARPSIQGASSTAIADKSTILAVRAAPGGGAGPALQFRIAERELPVESAAPESEEADLEDAVARLRNAIAASAAANELAAAHLGILDDPEILAASRRNIQAGANAAQAWRRAIETQVAAIRATNNPYFIERVADLLDLERQLIEVLLGATGEKRIEIPAGSILLAEELLPSDFLAIDPQRLSAIVTTGGGPTSHVAILAAARGVPMLVSAGPEILGIPDGTVVLVDDEHPLLRIAPSELLMADQARKAADEKVLAQNQLLAAQNLCRSSDGTRIEIFANCGSPEDAELARELGAEGCGLLRSEFLFLDRASAPSIEEQTQAYRETAARLQDRLVIVRTLDAGSDKPVAYLPMPREDNPALGIRGIRLALGKPDLLRDQFRAIIRGIPSSQRSIMLPMVSDLDEFERARSLLRGVEAEEGAAAPSRLGIMVETPAAAMMADQLAREVDFMSIGTNDLVQYTLAADRGHPSLAGRADSLHPAVLRLIAQTIAGARAHGCWVGICGAVASDVDAAPLLIGLGADELSVNPRQIPAIKARIASVSMAACRDLATAVLEAAPDVQTVRHLIATKLRESSNA